METSIYKQLSDYNKDETVRRLKEQYASPSNLEILGIDRIESVHSNFIAWLLENQNLAISKSENPLIQLLDIIIDRAKKQNIEIDDNFVNSIISRHAEIITVSVDKEVSYKSNNSDNRIDLIVNCVLLIGSEEKPVVIYLENKVDANETFNKKGDTGQTEVYYNQYHDESSDQIQLFVFLSPKIEKAICCDKFIRINYQSILESILEPLMQTKLRASDHLFIQNYIRALGVRVLDDQGIGSIMAITKEERRLFEYLYKKYNKLYKSAFFSKVVKKYIKSAPSTKKEWTSFGAVFKMPIDDALVLFWDKNKSFIRTAIELCEEDNKEEWLNKIQILNKDRTNYCISCKGKPVSAKVNKGHIARTIIQHYVNNINCKFQRDDDLESKLKKVFGEIRNPIIIKEKDKTDSTRNNYYKIENTQLLVPTNCWGQGSPQFKKLLKKANDLGYEIVALD